MNLRSDILLVDLADGGAFERAEASARGHDALNVGENGKIRHCLAAAAALAAQKLAEQTCICIFCRLDCLWRGRTLACVCVDAMRHFQLVDVRRREKMLSQFRMACNWHVADRTDFRRLGRRWFRRFTPRSSIPTFFGAMVLEPDLYNAPSKSDAIAKYFALCQAGTPVHLEGALHREHLSLRELRPRALLAAFGAVCA